MGNRLEAPGDKKDPEEEYDLILATYNNAAKKKLLGGGDKK